MNPKTSQIQSRYVTDYLKNCSYPLLAPSSIINPGDVLFSVLSDYSRFNVLVVNSCRMIEPMSYLKETEHGLYNQHNLSKMVDEGRSAIPLVFLEYWYAPVTISEDGKSIKESEIIRPLYMGDHWFDYEFPLMCSIYEKDLYQNPLLDSRLYKWGPHKDEKMDLVIGELKHAISMPLEDAIKSGKYLIHDHWKSQVVTNSA